MTDYSIAAKLNIYIYIKWIKLIKNNKIFLFKLKKNALDNIFELPWMFLKMDLIGHMT